MGGGVVGMGSMGLWDGLVMMRDDVKMVNDDCESKVGNGDRDEVHPTPEALRHEHW